MENSSHYRLFAQLPLERPPLPAVGDIEMRYCGWDAIWSSQLPLSLRNLISRWWLVCAATGHPWSPHVLTFWVNGEFAHSSFLLPRLGRLEGMSSGDIEIGPCFTAPAFRRRGLFRFAMQKIMADFWEPDRVVWMIVRADNESSCAAILGMNFTEMSRCERRSHAFLPIHTYRIIDPTGHALGGANSRGVRDTIVERARYNSRALQSVTSTDAFRVHGAAAIRETLREAFVVYHNFVREAVRPGWKVVDLCCGDGLHSITAAEAGAEVFAVDIADESLRLAQLRAQLNGTTLTLVQASAEELPFPDGSIDMVICAGGISYVDREIFLRELQRILRPGGEFVFVDCYNHNWIYRFNRFVHYLRGRRTLSTLRRMPDADLLALLRQRFAAVEVHYFGLLVFLVPLLLVFMNETKAADFLTRMDRRLAWLSPWSFRIVIRGRQRPAAGAT